MKNVFFKPWIGENYSTTGISGKKILLLGESHICGEGCGDCGNLLEHPNCSEFTNNAAKYFFNYKNGNGGFEYWMNGYTKFGNIFYNKHLSYDETVAFWDSIIFYNYVQYSTDKARVSPTNEEFEKSSDAFFEILEAYKPDLVFVWGERLWDQLPFSEDCGEDIIIDNSNGGKFYYYTLDEKKTPIYMINHPSSSAFNYSWHKFMQKAIELV
ncbi:MAG: hypothetical protein K0M40_03880 [Prolixibacteraceae bacterium]|nr:hypothetical protein [Prolixibacteraceae bacterium]